MLFRKSMEKRCGYCIHSTKLDEDTVLCVKKGLRADSAKCRKFKYDPTKREPLKAMPLDFDKYTEEDFTL